MEARPVLIHRHGLLAKPPKSTTHPPWTINYLAGNRLKGCMIMLSLRAFVQLLNEAIEVISLMSMHTGIKMVANMLMIMSGKR